MSKKSPVETNEPFNLVTPTQREADEMIQHLTVMKETLGWKLMVQILKGNMHVLEQCILLKQDFETGEILEETVVDNMREKLRYLRELTEKPDQLISALEGKTTETPDYDPYASTLKKK